MLVSLPEIMFANGPAVWWVAVCVAVAWFLQVLVEVRKVTRHDNLSWRYQVQVDGRKLSGHDKVVKVACKNHDNWASACNPIDFVLAAGTVRVQQYFKSWNEFDRIDFGGQLRSSPGCGSQLIKPSELAFVIYFIFHTFLILSAPHSAYLFFHMIDHIT